MDILTANDRAGVYPPSFYASVVNPLPEFPEAKGTIDCDVCVVGGGFTGLSSALHLAERGFAVVLLEAHRVGFGASGRNGGQVGSGQRLDQDDLEKMVGKEQAQALWKIACQSLDLVQDLIAQHKIDCHYVPGIIHADHRERFVKHSHAYVGKLQTEYNYEHIQALDRQQIRQLIGSDAYYGGSLDMASGHLNPLDFALGLAKAAEKAGVSIFERSRVSGVDEGDPAVITCNHAAINARYVVLGCNGYLGDLQPRVAAKVMPINNFIVATEPLEENLCQSLLRDNHAVADSKFVVNYFRLSEDNRMLFGGGETYGYRFPKDVASIAKKPMLETFPQLKDVGIDYAWGGTLGITMNRMPHFERLQGNILSASGFSGHGVAMATLAGSIMADAIEGQAGRFDVMASVPTRSFPGGAVFRWPLLVLAMAWYSLRDKL